MTTKMVKYLKPGDEVDGKQVEKVTVSEDDGSIKVSYVGIRNAVTYQAGACTEIG